MSEYKKQLQQPLGEQQIADIQELAGTLKYGSIVLVFQDGMLVQIEKHEKNKSTLTIFKYSRQN